MKSLRKLLVSALASSILCPSVSGVVEAEGNRQRSKSMGAGVSNCTKLDVVETNVQGRPKGRPKSPATGKSRSSKITLGMGIPVAVGIGVGVTCKVAGKKSSSIVPEKEVVPVTITDISSEVADRKKNIERTKKNIVELIGEEKYGVLHQACKKFSRNWPSYEGQMYLGGSGELIVPSITSLELMEGNSCSELQDKSDISLLFNSVKEINGFSRENLYGIISTCLCLIGNGIGSEQKIIGIESSDENWGNGFRFEPLSVKEYYSFFVNSDLNKIKLCYHDGYGTKNRDCTTVLEI